MQEVLNEACLNGERSLRSAAVALLPLLLPGASSTAPAGTPVTGVTPAVETSALAFVRTILNAPPSIVERAKRAREGR